MRLGDRVEAALAIGGDSRVHASKLTFNGLIDDVRIYNYALNATQIKKVYNNAAATRFAPAEGAP